MKITKLSYDTDLTDDQWQLICTLLPAAKSGGRPRRVNLREVLNAIFIPAQSGLCLEASTP